MARLAVGRAILPPLLHLGGHYGWQIENRNKEIKCGLEMDRLSDHRFMANYFRLYLHAAAMNLLVRLRREIAEPPPAPEGDVPVEALAGPTRKQYQNARRREDPLGKGQPATWRLLLIKVAASVMVRSRRIVVLLSGSWPNRGFFEHIGQHVSRRPTGAGCWTG
jgi:Transposase DDE domain group 1